MEIKNILKWVLLLAVIVGGTIYLASALLISEKVASFVDFRGRDTQSFKLIKINEPHLDKSVCTNTEEVASIASKGRASDSKLAEESESSRQSFHIESEEPPTNLFSSLVFNLVRLIMFAVFLLVPTGVLYVCLVRPIQEIQIVEPEVIRVLNGEDSRSRKQAGKRIAIAMWRSGMGSTDERQELKAAIKRPSNIDKTVKELLEKRENAARKRALEIAAMAGLTVAVSSSSIGDGLGMFVWKSRMVYETFRIYGFRPNARTVVSIWAHVVFASFFAASLEELCELFDVSEFVGGIGVRIIQGGAGAAMVLKGGSMTRKYLTNGVSSESQRQALAEFKETAKDDMIGVLSALRDSKHKTGYED